MAEVLLGGKRLDELKVTELKVELDKRGLQKKGNKSALLSRLKAAILREALMTEVSSWLLSFLVRVEVLVMRVCVLYVG